MSRTAIYKLRDKAVNEREWDLTTPIKPEHVLDSIRIRRPPISEEQRLFIIDTITRNSITRMWSCARIALEIASTIG